MPKRIIIFGNSGSGKSTMARRLAKAHRLSHLDLDDVAWATAEPPTRRPVPESEALILEFMKENCAGWVIEGCYTGLLQIAAGECTELRFLNQGIEACVQNCRRRAWEPAKYESKEAQDDMLETLIDWVRQYQTREDEFSLAAHRAFFDAFEGEKIEYLSNEFPQENP